jgi:hypothetical protein
MKIPTVIRWFSIVLIVWLSLSYPVEAAVSGFSFLNNARDRYTRELTVSGRISASDRVIDSLLKTDPEMILSWQKD